MSNSDLTSIFFILLLLVGLAHFLGYVMMRLHQPKVIGEILAGVVVGPSLIGGLPGLSWIIGSTQKQASILSFVYWLGLLLLMFISGGEIHQLFAADERREVSCLAIVGTGVPFVLALIAGPWLLSPALAGPNGNRISLTIVLGIAVAVTSIPVISKIFADLNILNTRFARLVLGVAVFEDVMLWLALALATAAAGKATFEARQIAYHLGTTIGYFVLGLTVVPRIVNRLSNSSFNVVANNSPIAYSIVLLLAYCVIAGAFDVSLVFAAFLAGFGTLHKREKRFSDALDVITKVSLAFFIPAYFALVGMKLDLKDPSISMITSFILGSCLVKVVSVSVAGRLAGFRGLALINLAITTNARGGPGIVLASVALDAGIISPAFYTTLVVAAVLTSQFAGAWLDYVLRKGWPLLQSTENSELITSPATLPQTVL